MKKQQVLFIIGCLFLFSSCSFFKNKGKDLKEEPLARVNDMYLYPSDISGLTSGGSKEDSIKLVQMYVTDWIKRSLLLDKAQKSIPSDIKEIDEKVENYRQSLILYYYENELLNSINDTFIEPKAIEKYYKEYSNNFVLEDDVYQFQFIVLPSNTAQLEDWITSFENTSDEGKVQLNNKVKIGAIKYELNPNKWYTRSSFIKQVAVSEDFFSTCKVSNDAQKFSNDQFVLLYRLSAVKPAGEIAPFGSVERNIYQILLNKKKADFLQSKYKEIYNNGLSKKEAEDFTFKK